MTLLAIIFLLLLATPIEASTFPAASCAQIDILNAVALASNGDTVTVPGTCPLANPAVWTDSISINKGITLQGAGIGQTVIEDQRVRVAGGPGTLLTVNIPQGASFRMTGFTFNGGATPQPATSDGTVIINGCSVSTADYRVDHNRFNQLTNRSLVFQGSLYGVTDNNSVVLATGGSTIFAFPQSQTWPRNGISCTGLWGDGSFAAPTTPGGLLAHYFESNNVSSAFGFSNDAAFLDSSSGARTVVRSNTFTEVAVSAHGTDSSGIRSRGNRWLEVYNNTFTFPNNGDGLSGQFYPVDYVVWLRGGTGVVFGNIINITNASLGFNNVVKHVSRRDVTSPNFFNAGSPWFACDGTQVWDGNQPGQNGYRCLDQPGAGTAVDWLDVNTPTTPAQNILDPIYVWNNTLNGVGNDCGIFGCFSDGNVVIGRDIFTGQARPNYVPLPFPHPLVSGAPTLPGTPTGLAVQ